VAQQVLEYLGVPHDIDVRPPHALSKADLHVAEDDSGGNTGDINALYAAANDLPSDDPLRASVTPPAPSNPSHTAAHAAAQPVNGKNPGRAPVSIAPQPALKPKEPQTVTTVILRDGKLLRVPSLLGLPVRKVIEQAAAAGLEVQVSGNGTVREQAPAAGSMVAPGTRIVVRCGR
jgi:cell division protein FtsI (penicillin-binding protein 3)